MSVNIAKLHGTISTMMDPRSAQSVILIILFYCEEHENSISQHKRSCFGCKVSESAPSGCGKVPDKLEKLKCSWLAN
jgi:hypothetical protein